MKLKPKITIADHFADLEDPRVERTIRPADRGFQNMAQAQRLAGFSFSILKTY